MAFGLELKTYSLGGGASIERPRLLSSLGLSLPGADRRGLVKDAAGGDKILCLFLAEGGFVTVDTSLPQQPAIASRLQLPLRFGMLEVINNTAVLAGRSLILIDLSRPSSPVATTLSPLAYLPTEMAVDGGYAFIREKAAGVHVLRISP